MTEEQKLQWLQGLMASGSVSITQLNLGDGTQNFHISGGEAQGGSKTDEQVRQAITELYEATVEDGDGTVRPLFSDKSQWYAVYRVLTEHCGYPSKMTDFVRLVEERGYSQQSPPCNYDSLKKAPQTCARLSCRTDLWQQFGDCGVTYLKQCRVAEFLLQRLGTE